MIKIFKAIKNKLTKPKLTSEQIANMASVIIGKEISLQNKAQITVTAVPGLKIVDDCEFIELIGTSSSGKTVSMVISIPVFKNIYNRSAAIDEEMNNVYVKVIKDEKNK